MTDDIKKQIKHSEKNIICLSSDDEECLENIIEISTSKVAQPVKDDQDGFKLNKIAGTASFGGTFKKWRIC